MTDLKSMFQEFTIEVKKMKPYMTKAESNKVKSKLTEMILQLAEKTKQTPYEPT